jgi:RNA polymerase sigma-70 factor, ECF subfamily
MTIGESAGDERLETAPAAPPDRSDPSDFGDAEEEAPDEVLVARVLGGERSAFAPLVRRHQGPLFRHALGMGLDPDAAARVVQDALVDAWESLECCRDPDRFDIWAGRILRNRCLDALKDAARRGAPLRVSLSKGRPDLESEEQGARRVRFERALSELPDEQREAFLMKHLEGRTYGDMAALTDESVTTMKIRVHRAREELQAGLIVGS